MSDLETFWVLVVLFPLFRRQIERGGPVTITHEDMVRPGIVLSQALKLITSVGELARG